MRPSPWRAGGIRHHRFVARAGERGDARSRRDQHEPAAARQTFSNVRGDDAAFGSRDVDAARALPPAFGMVTVRMPSFRSAVTAVDVDRFGQHERTGEAPVSALDAVILLARNLAKPLGPRRRAFATNDDAAVFGVNFDLVARRARALRREHEDDRRFRRDRPAASSPARRRRRADRSARAASANRAADPTA